MMPVMAYISEVVSAANGGFSAANWMERQRQSGWESGVAALA
jgi:hypothetical protein